MVKTDSPKSENPIHLISRNKYGIYQKSLLLVNMTIEANSVDPYQTDPTGAV